jgi:hypothetical protein
MVKIDNNGEAIRLVGHKFFYVIYVETHKEIALVAKHHLV